MWKKLERSKNGLYEIWKTYGRYLVCSRYLHEFKYFKNCFEAFRYFRGLDI